MEQHKKALTCGIVIFMLPFLGGCEFSDGFKRGFSDPVLAEKRDSAIDRIISVETKIEKLKKEKNVPAAIDAIVELNGLQSELRDIYKEAEARSTSGAATAGLLLSQFLMGMLGYFGGRGVRKGIGGRILNPKN